MINSWEYEQRCYLNILWQLNWIEEDDAYYDHWDKAYATVFCELVNRRDEMEKNIKDKKKLYHLIRNIMLVTKLHLCNIDEFNCKYYLAIVFAFEQRLDEILNYNLDFYDIMDEFEMIHCEATGKLLKHISFYQICHDPKYKNYSVGYDMFTQHEIYKEIKSNPCRTYGQAMELCTMIQGDNRTVIDLKKHVRYIMNLKFGIETTLPHIGKERRKRFTRWTELINEIIPIKPKERVDNFFYEPEYYEACRKLKLITELEDYVGKVKDPGDASLLVDVSTTDDSAVEVLETMGMEDKKVEINYKVVGIKRDKIILKIGNDMVRAKLKITGNKIKESSKYYRYMTETLLFYISENENYNRQVLSNAANYKINDMQVHLTRNFIFIPQGNLVYYTPTQGSYSIVEKKKMDNFEIIKPKKLRKKTVKPIGNEICYPRFEDTYRNIKEIIKTKNDWEEVKKKSKIKIETKPNIVHVNKFEFLPVYRKTQFKIHRNLGINTEIKFDEKPKDNNKKTLKKFNKDIQSKKNKIYNKQDNDEEQKKRQVFVDRLNDRLKKNDGSIQLTTLDFVRSKLFNKNNNKLYKLNYESIQTITEFNYCKKNQLSFNGSKRKIIVKQIQNIVADLDFNCDMKLI
jgi:hypothetical protein